MILQLYSLYDPIVCLVYLVSLSNLCSLSLWAPIVYLIYMVSLSNLYNLYRLCNLYSYFLKLYSRVRYGATNLPTNLEEMSAPQSPALKVLVPVPVSVLVLLRVLG